ncbi:cytoskeletal protein CcmA (bactofilin family) [Caldalkalibacillus uzonensis]|uniref:Cytoskeletal protein CcmA (Bactofilin family) n=1 Tax=Caldalkalibacillus uzonensis TaxID=353224 RepID=A0ABU0CRV4_9BACI|nr:hypothetical protein [Caldalkalibacillus uzonensis]MDQ0338808.1 cytoskeletal protein CcmA (bactofilin family) [Caldalkalibacillus uzonensis]
MNEQKQHIKIYGDGSMPGGKFDKVSIMGHGCVEGDLTGKQCKIFGKGELEGKAVLERLCVFGTASIHGLLIANVLEVFGNLDVMEKMTGDRGRITGWLTVKGNVEMEELSVKGGLKVEGLLNAGIFNLRLQHNTSRIREIGAEKITVQRKRLKLFKPHDHLEAEVIEGDRIFLEYTTAKIVRGNKITLGPHCEIELVEYNHTFEKVGRGPCRVADVRKISIND